MASSDTNYNHFGPMIGHRYIIENTWDAFNDALTPASSEYGITGIWFLDRHTTPWVLNYIANQDESPRHRQRRHPATWRHYSGGAGEGLHWREPDFRNRFELCHVPGYHFRSGRLLSQ